MSELNPRIAVYPGSFDPITLGHLNVMERASRLFDRLIVGIGINIDKRAMFEPREREELIALSTSHVENIEIRAFSGLTVTFVRECGARVMIRGVRPITDIPAELTMMIGELAHVSSALIKQIAPLAGDDELGRFLPEPVVHVLRARMQARSA
jgi:pantetheine-phosphate adenylyltransferase